MTSFAPSRGPGVFGGSSEVKTLGTSGDGSDEEDEEDDGKPVEGFEKEKEDERFFEQESMLSGIYGYILKDFY